MKFILLSFVVITFWSTAFYAFSAEISDDMLIKEYTPIVGIPGLDISEGLTTEGYVNALYLLAITVSALLAVVKIIFAGVRYTLSDVITDKGKAIADIKGALLGLLIVLSAVLILNTINTDLTTINIFGNAPQPTINKPAPTPPPTGPVTGKDLVGGTAGEMRKFIGRCNDERPTSIILSPPNTIRCLPSL